MAVAVSYSDLTSLGKLPLTSCFCVAEVRPSFADRLLWGCSAGMSPAIHKAISGMHEPPPRSTRHRPSSFFCLYDCDGFSTDTALYGGHTYQTWLFDFLFFFLFSFLASVIRRACL